MTKSSSSTGRLAEFEALHSEGNALRATLAHVSDLPLTEPREGALADLLAAARRWMEREAAFRANEHLKLGLREMEHFEEVAYLQSHQASGPDWLRLIVLKLGFRLERLSKLRKQASAS